MKTPSITWKKFTDTMVIGRVGDVECFHIIREGRQAQLVSSLPEVTPGCVGRTVEMFASPALAVRQAQTLFQPWYIRLHKEST